MVIDKETHQIGLFDCSPDFYKSGEEKVRKARHKPTFWVANINIINVLYNFIVLT